MFNEKFMDVLAHEGVVSIVSWANNDAHVVNTWNSYIVVKDGNKLLIPAAGMRNTEKNVDINNNVKLTIGSHEVKGFKKLGTGFYINGTARFIKEGEDFAMMKEKYAFLSRLLEITVTSCKQTL